MTATDSQLDLFAPKPSGQFLYREGHEYARPEPTGYVEECIDGFLHSVQDQSNLRAFLEGKGWQDVHQHCGRYALGQRWECSAKGLAIYPLEKGVWEPLEVVKPDQIKARAMRYERVEDLTARGFSTQEAF